MSSYGEDFSTCVHNTQWRREERPQLIFKRTKRAFRIIHLTPRDHNTLAMHGCLLCDRLKNRFTVSFSQCSLKALIVIVIISQNAGATSWKGALEWDFSAVCMDWRDRSSHLNIVHVSEKCVRQSVFSVFTALYDSWVSKMIILFTCVWLYSSELSQLRVLKYKYKQHVLLWEGFNKNGKLTIQVWVFYLIFQWPEQDLWWVRKLPADSRKTHVLITCQTLPCFQQSNLSDLVTCGQR